MNVRKTDDFIADVERQFEWYTINAGWAVANRYLDAVEATCRLLVRIAGVSFNSVAFHPKVL